MPLLQARLLHLTFYNHTQLHTSEISDIVYTYTKQKQPVAVKKGAAK